MEVHYQQISSIYLVILSVILCCTDCDTKSSVPNSTNIKPVLNKAEQIHLSFGSAVNNINVMWSTKGDVEGYVEYGTDINDPSSFIQVKSTTVELTEFSEKAARFVHRAVLENLEVDTLYWYCIISGMRSEKFTFRVPHNNSKQHKFVVLADVGVLTKSLPFLVHEVLNGGYGAVFHIGDIAYDLHADEGRVGDLFMNKIDNFTARVPYMTTPGDHEKYFQFYHYRNRFSMPGASWPMIEDRLWYSINIGPVHFISINTHLTPPSEQNQDQLQWLKNDLAMANLKRGRNPWIIVMGHKPLYCTKSVMKQDCDQKHFPLREQLEDLFFEQGVDLYISGHKHCYERSWPMYQGRVFQTDNINPMAPIYIITGTTGYEYLVDKQFSRPFWLASAVSDGRKELYARLTVVNASHLIWSMHAIISNEEVENVQIIQNRHGSFGTAGPSAFSKLKFAADLPAQPFFLVDVQSDHYSRTLLLYLTVLALSLIIIAFLRTAKVRKVLRTWW